MQHSKKIPVLIIMFYLILMVPYTIISNAGETGIVIENQKISVDSLSTDIQDLLINKKDSYNIVLIEDVYPKQINQITLERNQVAKERKIILSRETQEKGSFVRIDSMTTYMYITYNAIPALNKSFEKLIIGDTKKARFGKIIEIISRYNLTPILILSKIDVLAGGFLVVLLLSFLLHRTIALWNIPAIITCYSFQSFLANIVSGMNQLEVDSTYLLFGLLFVPALLFVFKLKTFEETIDGRKRICELYEFNIKILKKIIRIK